MIEKICYYIRYLILYEYVRLFVIIINSFRIIVASIFFYSVFILENLLLFFKVIPFLIFPVIFECLLFMIIDMAEKNILFYEDRLILSINDDGVTQCRLNTDNKDNPWLKIKCPHELSAIIKDHGPIFLEYKYGRWFVLLINEAEKKIKPYVYLYVYGLYTIGWGYIIIRTLYLS